MILFSKSHKTSWEQLIGQGHDRYWSVRDSSYTLRATMQEGQYRSARTSAEYPLNTDLLLVGTIEGDGNRKIWMYDMAGDLVTSGAEDYYASNTLIPSSKTGSSPGHDSRICMGWSVLQGYYERPRGIEIRAVAVWDVALSDSDIVTNVAIMTAPRSPSPPATPPVPPQSPPPPPWPGYALYDDFSSASVSDLWEYGRATHNYRRWRAVREQQRLDPDEDDVCAAAHRAGAPIPTRHLFQPALRDDASPQQRPRAKPSPRL